MCILGFFEDNGWKLLEQQFLFYNIDRDFLCDGRLHILNHCLSVLLIHKICHILNGLIIHSLMSELLLENKRNLPLEILDPFASDQDHQFIVSPVFFRWIKDSDISFDLCVAIFWSSHAIWWKPDRRIPMSGVDRPEPSITLWASYCIASGIPRLSWPWWPCMFRLS